MDKKGLFLGIFGLVALMVMLALLPKYNFSGTKEAIGIALVCITMMITAPAVIIKSMRPAFVRSKSKI